MRQKIIDASARSKHAPLCSIHVSRFNIYRLINAVLGHFGAKT